MESLKQRNKKAAAIYRKRKLSPDYIPRNSIPARIRRPISIFKFMLKRYWPNLPIEDRYKAFEQLLIEQAGRCGICETPLYGKHMTPNELNIDHDHISGVVRGLLCRRCNACLHMHITNDIWRNIGKYLNYAEA